MTRDEALSLVMGSWAGYQPDRSINDRETLSEAVKLVTSSWREHFVVMLSIDAVYRRRRWARPSLIVLDDQ